MFTVVYADMRSSHSIIDYDILDISSLEDFADTF